jgi:murein DD-endopeptidase MepM/ murein hydrolase activator NlpD
MRVRPSQLTKQLVLLAFLAFSPTIAAAQVPQPISGDVPSFSSDASAAPAVRAPRPEVTARVALKPLSPANFHFALGEAPPGSRGRVIPMAPRFASGPGTMITVRANALRATGALRINSGFGYRHDPITGLGRLHTGVDIKAAYGETVGASASGVVVFAGVRGGYGNLVIVDHGNHITSYYGHLSSMRVLTGETVLAGQIVGSIGSTGRSTGPHLHYEVRARDRAVDPASAIRIDEGKIFTNGVLVSGPPVDGGDEYDAPAGQGANSSSAKKRGPIVRLKGGNSANRPSVLVAGEGSLTNY